MIIAAGLLGAVSGTFNQTPGARNTELPIFILGAHIRFISQVWSIDVFRPNCPNEYVSIIQSVRILVRIEFMPLID
jgi:hypothetical protein